MRVDDVASNIHQALSSGMRGVATVHTLANSSALRAAALASEPDIISFLNHLATCHTVVPVAAKPGCAPEGVGGLVYQAASPDEVGRCMLKPVASRVDGAWFQQLSLKYDQPIERERRFCLYKEAPGFRPCPRVMNRIQTLLSMSTRGPPLRKPW